MSYFDLFKQTVLANSDKPVIADSDARRTLSYCQLDELSGKIAAKLSALKCKKGDAVIVRLGRKAEFIAAELGVMKLGCAAVPILPSYPQERVDYISRDCKAELIIEEDFFGDIDSFASIEPVETDPNDRAMIIYTSGSTGKPKGVVYSSRAFEAAVERMKAHLENISPLVFAAVGNLTFVASVLEYFTVLSLGGCTHILSDEARVDIGKIQDYYAENRITAGFLSPRVLKLYKNSDKYLKVIITASERLVDAYSADYTIYNSYGQSETIGTVMSFKVDREYDNTPIGTAVKGVKAFLIDSEGNEIDGGEGELCVQGVFAEEYLNKPEETAKTFKKLPNGEVVIRTGDIAEKLPDGNFVYINRKDWMVKINGQRVEPGEIEAVLKNIPGVTDAAVKDFDANGQVYLCGYYTSDRIISSDVIRNELKKFLPDYMIPAYFIQLEKMPVNINGKLDRFALQPPKVGGGKNEYAAPTNVNEEILCSSFEKVLNCGRVGIDDDFFMLGGDSIKVMQLQNECGLAGISTKVIFDGKTPRGISKILENIKTENHAVRSDYPITQTQYGIFVECSANPDATVYNIPLLLKLGSGVDTDKLKTAAEKTVNAHPYMKTRLFLNENGEIRAKRNDGEAPAVEIKNCKVLPEAAELVRPYELLGGRLYRAQIIKTPEAHFLFLDLHHIICDGASARIIIDDINSCYAGKTPISETYTGYEAALDEKKARTPEAVEKAKRYYDSVFAGCDTDFLPIKDKSGGAPSVDVCCAECAASAESIKKYCGDNNITMNAFFNGVFGFVLAGYNNKDESVYTTVYNGRSDSRLSRSVSMFVKTFPIRYNADGGKKITEILSEIKAQIMDNMSNDLYSFAEISKEYGITAEILFVYQGDSLDFNMVAGEKAEEYPLKLDTAKAPITVNVHLRNNKIIFSCEYRSDMYERDSVTRMLGCLSTVSEEFVHKTYIREVSLMTSEARALIDSFNCTEKSYDTGRTVVDLFREQARKNPDNTAVVYLDRRYTYKQTDDISEKIGAYISSLGIGREDVVSVLIPRCEYMAIASLGISKSGAAYQPLDPSYPKERLEFMMNDANAKLLITSRELSKLVPNYGGNILFIEDIPNLPESGVSGKAPSPEDLFIMLYTSGSTGTPKGCMLEHRNIASFCNWYRNFYSLTSKSKVAAYASYGFDANMMDMYPALTTGAALYIIDEAIRLDLLAIDRYFNENGITHSFMTTQVGRQFALECTSEKLKYLSVGGEKLVPVDLKKNFRFYNGYGPTECTIFTTTFQVDRLYERVPIGKALDNMKLYVVDKYGRLVPPGVPGELWVAGHGVSRGYLNRPEQNEKAFIENPFTDEKGYERIYRTGDIVRYLPDGNIDFVGRNDGQVKIRGFRVELPEVEKVIRDFDGIKDATVAAFDDPNGGKFIAAYVVSDKKIDIRKLNDFILANKPPYMVPAVTMQIDSIPLNQNQKVNKRALPAPQKKVEETVKPSNDVQQKIFDCISKVIGNDSFGVTTDIFYAGLTSIGSIKLNVELAKAFDAVIKISDLKENNTVEKLEKFLSNAKASEKYEILPDYPITRTQNGIFVECAANPDTTMYNIPYLFKLSDKVDIDRLRSAVESAVNAHPYMKTRLFLNENGDIRAKRNDGEKAEVDMIECEELPDKTELCAPFGLLKDRLYRARIYVTAGGSYLFLELHHIICDGTSEAVLIEDINSFYDGKAVEIETYSGFEAALDEEKARQTAAYTKAKSYYDSVFSGCDTEFLPAKDKKLSEPSVGYLEFECEVPAEKVEKFCGDNNVTLNAFFNSVFGLVLAKYNYKDEALFTTVYNGRNDSRLSRAVTMLVKTFPVHCNIDGGKKIADLLLDTKNQLMESMSNDIYSFAEISRRYNIKADIMFVYQGGSFSFDDIGGEKAESISLGLNAAKAPISINVIEKDGKFVFWCEYRSDMYDESTIFGIAECISAVTGEFLKKTYIKEVSMLSQRTEKYLSAVNSTDVPIRQTTCDKLFEEQALKNPDKVAVIANKRALTYRQLNENANRVANRLIECGARPDDMIGAMMPRTVLAYAARQGILKAGGAFMPLDPKYPDDRISYILEDSGARFVVTVKETAENRKALFEKSGVKPIIIEEILKSDKIENPDIDISPSNLCYCIYTSGSTGKPKGVMIEHHSLVNFVDYNRVNMQSCEFCDNMSVSLALAALTFDVSVLEETLPLYHGTTVVMANEDEINNPVLLARLLIENKVDVMKCTPSYMNNILDVPQIADALKNMKAIDIGAEAFPGPLYDKMRQLGITAKIHNGYGPTEATITTSIDLVESAKITIGKPLCNTKVYMLDKYRNILPPNVPGELTILGDCVGRGYVGREELTKDKFITFENMPAYRSGDLAYWGYDEKIHFMGRMDNQVKLRGLRIELDEIENVMNSYPDILRSVVVVKENPKTGQFLCGYFTASAEIDKEKLTAHMKRSLTHYMIPGVLVQLDSFPLTANGKINKKALPEPELTVRERHHAAPVNELQKKLCAMFANALGTDEVGIDEDFFECGGTSLSASKIAMLALTENLPIAYGDIFDNPTVEMLEKHILRQQGRAEAAEESHEERENTAPEGIEKALMHNTSKYVDEIKYTDIGDVLLTGSTGFLGVHVLRELITNTGSKVYCLVRKGSAPSIEARLKSMLVYYFSDGTDELFGSRIIPLEGDITDKNAIMPLESRSFSTVINCAACVKHFSNDDTLERINVNGVKNLIDMCVKTGRRLVQISTVSVAGVNVNRKFPAEKKLHENELYFGQDLTNKYIDTKFRAEKAVLEAVADGKLDGKIIRVGNLMSRHSDGEFQVNARTNSFMRSLRAYAAIGKFPVSRMDSVTEFSPIDCTAKAIVRLSGTDSSFTVFQACNSHSIQMGDVIEILNKCGIKVEVVKDEVFADALNAALKDESKNMLISGLISYASSDRERSEEYIGCDISFTTKSLYRLGFKWPITGEAYLENALNALATLGFFEERLD